MKGIALFSGGLDSTLVVGKLLEAEHEITPLFVDYGQYPIVNELRACSDIHYYLKSRHIYDLNNLEVVKIDIGRSVAAFWGRSIAMVGIAAMWAYLNGDDYEFVALGHHSGDVGLDCKPGDFDKALNESLEIATNGRLCISLPIKDLTSNEIGPELKRLGIPFTMTYNCYWSLPCGWRSDKDEYRCPGCLRKRKAMEAAGLTDPELLDHPNTSVRTYFPREFVRGERVNHAPPEIR